MNNEKEHGGIKHISDSEFEAEITRSAVPVLIDFWAPWCGPCKMISPVLKQIAEEYENKVKIVKINVDDNQQVASYMGIQAIPTLALFDKGKPVETITGVQPRKIIENLIQKYIT